MKRSLGQFDAGTIRLRLIEETDLPFTLAWRNRDDTRIWFKNSEPITPEQHQTWFHRYLGKEDDFVFVVEADGQRVGQAAIYGIDWSSGKAEVGRFVSAPDHRGRGYIRQACNLLTLISWNQLGLHYLFLEVLESNEVAKRIYAANGFKEESRAEGLIKMGLHRPDDYTRLLA